MNIETKELTPIRAQASKVLNAAQGVTIKTQDDLIKAADITHNIKEVQKSAEAAKKKITDPLNEALKAARALFAPIEEAWKQAETILKTKILSYNREVETERLKKEAELAAKVEAGKMRPDTAAKKLELVPEANQSVQGKKGEIQFRTNRKPVVYDETLVPRQYLILDMVKIRKDALNGIEIPGVKVIEEKIIAAY